jgi:hypothetical protein
VLLGPGLGALPGCCVLQKCAREALTGQVKLLTPQSGQDSASMAYPSSSIWDIREIVIWPRTGFIMVAKMPDAGQRLACRG